GHFRRQVGQQVLDLGQAGDRGHIVLLRLLLLRLVLLGGVLLGLLLGRGRGCGRDGGGLQADARQQHRGGQQSGADRRRPPARAALLTRRRFQQHGYPPEQVGRMSQHAGRRRRRRRQRDQAQQKFGVVLGPRPLLDGGGIGEVLLAQPHLPAQRPEPWHVE